jgi:ectoine hydroxylase-related dioxygenase (phytanoyl-CoA dioxygenase family)
MGFVGEGPNDRVSYLEELGVRHDTLTQAEKDHLDGEGYLRLPAILTAEQVDAFRVRLDELVHAEGDQAGQEVHQEQGTDRLADLVNKGEMFQVCFTHPRVLAAVAHVLQNDLKLSSLNAREARPGEGLQALHADFGEAVAPGHYQVCNSIWLIDDFTGDNGSTRVVPGTHRTGKMPKNEMADPSQTHRNEVQLVAPAGTVMVFNAHVWHGGTRNISGARRRAMHAYYCRRSLAQQLDQRKYIRPETLDRLTPAMRYVLDVA